MDEQRKVKISKYLSKHLRHTPEQIGLTLAPGGWVKVDDLMKAMAFPLTRAELDEVVATNSKQRFAFDDSGTLIRANQGHSVEVDLQLEAVTPPAVLYHGTGAKSVESISKTGLTKMQRHHVHLSADTETAHKVGARHGRPVILAIDAAAMHRDGFVFYRSANGVWLVDSVPVKYMRRLTE